MTETSDYEEYLPGIFVRADQTARINIAKTNIHEGAVIHIDVAAGSTLSLTSLTVKDSAQVSIGRKSVVRSMTLGFAGDGARLEIGDSFRCGPTHIVVKYGSVRIGHNVLFSHGITIRTTDMHSIFDKATGERINLPAPVSIDDHVWLGQDVIVGKGASIGRDSVVAARSFVSRSFPPESLIGGSPGKVLREGITWSHKDGPE